MESYIINVKQVENGIIPVMKRKGDVCFDCASRVDVTIKVGERAKIPLGFCIELPPFLEGVIRPRSGMSLNGVDSCIGTIDSNYRGEVNAIIVNNTGKKLEIKAGERICQLAIRHIPTVEFKIVNELSETERGSNGFGSSGVW